MGLMGHFQFAFATRHACTCKGKKPTIVVSLKRGGVELNSKCKHAISKGISGGPTYYMAYGQDLSTSKNIRSTKVVDTHKQSMRVYKTFYSRII